MKKISFCIITVLLMMSVLCLPLFSATGAPTSTYLLGDADGDRDVTSMDVTLIQRVLSNQKKDDDGSIALRGDVDGDGELTAIDITLIQRYLANMYPAYPIGEQVGSDPTEEETIAPTQAPTQAPTVAPTVRPTSKPDPYELPPI